MPTYDFRCQECGHTFTVKVSYQEKDKVTCPQCGSSSIRQSFAGVNIFAGGGGCSAPAGSRFT